MHLEVAGFQQLVFDLGHPPALESAQLKMMPLNFLSMAGLLIKLLARNFALHSKFLTNLKVITTDNFRRYIIFRVNPDMSVYLPLAQM